MVFRLTSFLALLSAGVASHGDVGGVVNSTAQVIGTLRSTGAAAERRFANTSEIDEQLDEIGRRAEADFDVKLYSEKRKAFSELARHASEKAKQSLSSKNATVAEELSDEAEMAVRNMTKVDFELDAMEKKLHDGLHGALAAKLSPELAVAAKFSGEASHLQEAAHSMMDPLYSWGDAAEDKADSLNDQTNHALSSVDKVVRTYRRHITRHARAVQRGVEKKLLSGKDRTAEWRRAHREVRAATWHVSDLRYLASANILSLQLGSVGGLTVLMTTSAAAAAAGGLVVGFVLKLRATRSNDYQLLSA